MCIRDRAKAEPAKAEEAHKQARKTVEARLKFLARMYATDKEKQTEEESEEEIEEAKKVKQAEVEEKSEEA